MPELVPIRYGRMATSAFAFLRGSAAVMASDLAGTPASGIRLNCCGDAHLSNYGSYATPERRLVFDLNDFDENAIAPFEWDVKRLAASVVVAGRVNGFREKDCRAAARATIRAYRTRMLGFARMSHLEVWYSSVDAVAVLELVGARHRKQVEQHVARARARTNLGALSKLTDVVDGKRRIKDDPPLVEHVGPPGQEEATQGVYRQYRDTLPPERRGLLDRYRYADSARKVAGVGSVGTRAYIVLLLGDGDDDPLFLQIKQAQASVLESHAGASRFRNHGKRVVSGQRIMQAASDIFLGWISDGRGSDFYVRQLRDMKGSVDVSSLDEDGLAFVAGICGWALARAHARAGDAATLAGYMGRGDGFERAIAGFGAAYADQTERDHEALVQAIETGRLEAVAGV